MSRRLGGARALEPQLEDEATFERGGTTELGDDAREEAIDYGRQLTCAAPGPENCELVPAA